MSPRPVIRKHNPATLELVGEVGSVLPQDIFRMVEEARQAQTEWASLPLKRRSKVLRQVQSLLVDRADDYAELVSQEAGKPIMESLATDVMNALSVGDFAIGRMEHIFQESKVDFENLSSMMHYMGRSSYLVPRPLGVVGLITPWNYPLAVPYSQTMMCLAAGNGVVLKPSSQTPLTSVRMKETMDEAGLPSGLLQVAVGAGSEVGEALVTSNVDRIIFTGHSDVGQRIMALASQRLTPITLELGGKDAFIVLRDADLRRAAKAACWGSFVNCGQTCAAVKRIYVDRTVAEKFTSLLLENVKALKQGYDLNDTTMSVGPLISEAAVEDMEAQLSRALQQGAKVLTGGKRPFGLKGYFFEPTVLDDVTQNMDIVRQETFGPIVSLLTFQDEQEAVRLANDNDFALNGSVWTADLDKGRKIAMTLRSGTITVNNVAYTYGLGATPWGGRGKSGFGRTHGDMGFEELLERQHVHLDKGKFPSEIWWPPYGEDSMEAMRDFTGLAFNGERDRLLQRLLKARRLMKR
ncbi:MAG: aldehyde dehydrogenase family protein [Methanomassiliicoccales archaeon]|nr:aldehyde dehydrogenase family protein [Methanomassiliicoccales archaeon]